MGHAARFFLLLLASSSSQPLGRRFRYHRFGRLFRFGCGHRVLCPRFVHMGGLSFGGLNFFIMRHHHIHRIIQRRQDVGAGGGVFRGPTTHPLYLVCSSSYYLLLLLLLVFLLPLLCVSNIVVTFVDGPSSICYYYCNGERIVG